MSNQPDWLLPPIDELGYFPVEQIGKQLANICRYAGATPHFYSVARHSMLVNSLVPNEPNLKLMALVHDVHECWIGDMLRPAKRWCGRAVDDLEKTYDRKIWALLGLDPSPVDEAYIRCADDEACRLELLWLGKSFVDIEHDDMFQRYWLSTRPQQQMDSVKWIEAVRDLMLELD